MKHRDHMSKREARVFHILSFAIVATFGIMVFGPILKDGAMPWGGGIFLHGVIELEPDTLVDRVILFMVYSIEIFALFVAWFLCGFTAWGYRASASTEAQDSDGRRIAGTKGAVLQGSHDSWDWYFCVLMGPWSFFILVVSHMLAWPYCKLRKIERFFRWHGTP